MTNPTGFPPGRGPVLQGLIGKVNKISGALEVAADEIAACLKAAQLCLRLGRVQHVGGQVPRLRELGVEPSELPQADPVLKLVAKQPHLPQRGLRSGRRTRSISSRTALIFGKLSVNSADHR